MRVQVYEQLMAMQASRRNVLKGAAGAAALAASSSVLSSTSCAQVAITSASWRGMPAAAASA